MKELTIETTNVTPAAALDIACKAYADEDFRKHGLIIQGSNEDSIAWIYQASRHLGLHIDSISINGKKSPLTKAIKTRKEADWKVFMEEKVSAMHAKQKAQQATQDQKAAAKSDPMKQLEALIGLTDVKSQMTDICNLMKNRKDRERVGLPTIEMGQHLVFTGNPGTGKTTVARLVGEIYRDLGVLKKGHFIETDGRGLIAEYIGQTAEKTRAIITQALDGVLFIDEAYALVHKDSAKDFGQEAVATLIKMMEDHRDRLVVIVAGYTKEMEQLLMSNPGMKSRFKTMIDFPDYSEDELAKIFKHICGEHAYLLTHDAKQSVNTLFTEMHRHKNEHFGNGRSVRNGFDRAVMNHARRLARAKKPSKRDLQTLQSRDIPKLEDLDW